jgi:hypothetical protein
MELDSYERILTINPPTLFKGTQIGRNAKLLLTLINKKAPLTGGG